MNPEIFLMNLVYFWFSSVLIRESGFGTGAEMGKVR